MPQVEMRAEPFQTVRWTGPEGEMEADAIVTFNAQAVGVSGGRGGIVNESATHVLTVFDHMDGLDSGQRFTVESEFRGIEHFTVLDFDPQPFGVTLYARREDRERVDPGATNDTPSAPDTSPTERVDP